MTPRVYAFVPRYLRGASLLCNLYVSIVLENTGFVKLT